MTFALTLGASPSARERRSLRCVALALALTVTPALAQDDPVAELDSLSRDTATSAGGLALASNLSISGDLLGALSTLDRVLMLEPAAQPALLLRASLLCRIDDKAGGSAQLARLRKRDFAKEDWNQVSSQCAGPRSAPTQRSERWRRPGF